MIMIMIIMIIMIIINNDSLDNFFSLKNVVRSNLILIVILRPKKV